MRGNVRSQRRGAKLRRLWNTVCCAEFLRRWRLQAAGTADLLEYHDRSVQLRHVWQRLREQLLRRGNVQTMPRNVLQRAL